MANFVVAFQADTAEMETVLQSPMIAEPLGLFDCCGVSDGSVHVGPTPRLGVSVTTSRSGGGSESKEVGVEVLWVVYGTPAYDAGLEIGHVIVAFDRQPVTSTAELEDLLLHRSPGDTVHVEWLDETGRSRGADVTLDTGPAR